MHRNLELKPLKSPPKPYTICPCRGAGHRPAQEPSEHGIPVPRMRNWGFRFVCKFSDDFFLAVGLRLLNLQARASGVGKLDVAVAPFLYRFLRLQLCEARASHDVVGTL